MTALHCCNLGLSRSPVDAAVDLASFTEPKLKLTNRRSVKELCALAPSVKLEEEDNQGETHSGVEEGLGVSMQAIGGLLSMAVLALVISLAAAASVDVLRPMHLVPEVFSPIPG
jgi:hypothetical protein